MRIDDDARTYLWWRDGEITADPTGATVELKIDATKYAMTWEGAAVQSGASWVVTARTTFRFAGSLATISGTDVRPAVGRHMAQPIITTTDGQVVTGPMFPVDVS